MWFLISASVAWVAGRSATQLKPRPWVSISQPEEWMEERRPPAPGSGRRRRVSRSHRLGEHPGRGEPGC